MAWTVERKDAITRDGQKATFIEYTDRNWPCPWKFKVGGDDCYYSIGGFIGNHQLDQHDLDLVGLWEQREYTLETALRAIIANPERAAEIAKGALE